MQVKHKNNFISHINSYQLSEKFSRNFRSDISYWRQLHLELSTSCEIRYLLLLIQTLIIFNQILSFINIKTPRSPHIGGIKCLAIENINNRYLLAGAYDGRASLYDLESFSAPATPADRIRCERIISPLCLSNEPNNHVNRCILSSIQWFPVDTGLFLTASMGGIVRLWGLESIYIVYS